jgi:DNA adenine methylase
MKTPIRWAGSKKTLLPTLRKFWINPEARYIEPFCGSACLFFDIEPKEAILNDINGELITTYRALRADPSRVVERLLRFKRSESSYYRERAISPSTLSDTEVAARFLFLNRLCFNGIYRTNRAGSFNVPFAKPKNAIVFDLESFTQLGSLLGRATLLNADFEDVLKEANEGDFVYLDPPYALSKRRVFAEYHPDSFSTHDLERLRACLVDLDQRGAHFVISYADCPEGRLLVADWKSKRVRTRRNVAGFAGHRRDAYEIMASNREWAR